jgi:hypothetical protein
MPRRILAAAAVALLLTTAGCGGVLGGDPATRTPFGVAPTPTPTATPTETPPPTTTAPPTTTETATPAAPPELARALSLQLRRIERLESYTLESDATTEVEGEVATLRNTTGRIDRSENEGRVLTRYIRPRRSNQSVYATYRSGGTAVSKRVGPEGDPLYRILSPDDVPASAAEQFFADFSGRLRAVAFERNGSATFDGRVMPRYTASGVEAAPPGVGDPVDYRVTLLIDDGGLLRMVEQAVVERNEAGDRLVERTRLALTGIDTTTVERPDWVETALERTENATTATPDPPAELRDALDRQAAAVRELESYTLERDRVVTVDDRVGTFTNRTFRVNWSSGTRLERTRRLRTGETNASSVAVYRDGGTFLERRVSPEGGTVYRDPEGRDPVEIAPLVLRSVARDLSDVGLERNGTATFDGETVTRYTAFGVGNAPPEESDVVDYRATVLVDDGLVRVVSIRLVQDDEGPRTVTRFRTTLTGIGTTTVERPEWVGPATNRTGTATTTDAEGA